MSRGRMDAISLRTIAAWACSTGARRARRIIWRGPSGTLPPRGRKPMRIQPLDDPRAAVTLCRAAPMFAADICVGEVVPEIFIIDIGFSVDAALKTDREIFPGHHVADDVTQAFRPHLDELDTPVACGGGVVVSKASLGIGSRDDRYEGTIAGKIDIKGHPERTEVAIRQHQQQPKIIAEAALLEIRDDRLGRECAKCQTMLFEVVRDVRIIDLVEFRALDPFGRYLVGRSIFRR